MGQNDTNLQPETGQKPPVPARRTVLLTPEGFRKLLESEADRCGSMAELARRLNVTGQFIGKLIDGTKRPGRKVLSAMNARALTMVEIEVEGE